MVFAASLFTRLAPCPEESAGSCTWSACPPPKERWREAFLGTPSAGPLTFSGFRFEGSGPTTLESPAWGLSARPREQWPAEGGTPVRVVAAGAEVPAFSLEVSSPARLEVSGFDGRIDRDAPLSLSWNESSQGEVVVVLSLVARVEEAAAPDWSRGATIVCVYPPSAAGGAIPAEALAHLPEVDPAAPWSVQGGLWVERRSRIADDDVAFEAISSQQLPVLEVR
jgi:hypothetical protein